ncbi:MAG: D-glycerate dehydrogenase [Candidatus Bathyarchaeota archaeon]|nr:MAG: D-glycerate dehydrogenase [Candidatus Bathyarchaeota archaeon]
MGKPRVYVTRQLFDEAMDVLERHAEVDVFEGVDEAIPRDLLLSEVSDVKGLLPLLTERIDEEVMDAGRQLRVISNYAVGYNNIDVEAATERGIYVTNTPGILTDTTADCAFALLMAASRRIPEADRHVRARKWIHAWGPRMFIGSDIHGKTLGIVGMGRIGKATARRGRGFDMKIIYSSNTRKPEIEEELGAKFVGLDELLREADYVSLHVPLNDSTRHMIGERELSMMKGTAYLINTSRGPVVDEEALFRALRDGAITGAGLDVFEREPVDGNSPLLGLENIVVTPHIASASVETRTKMAVTAATNLVSVLQGIAPPNLVNPEVKKIKPLES